MKVVRSLITATVLALAVTAPADAARPFQQLWEKKIGAWTAFGGINGANQKVVGLNVIGTDRAIFLKHFVGSERVLTVQIFKTTWRFPKEGVAVPVRVEFDGGADFYTATAQARMDEQGVAVVEFGTEDGKVAGNLLASMARANTMTVRFEEGDETPWVARMTGSRAAVDLFLAGVAAFHKDDATQPYGAPQATQPYGQRPTQPYNTSKPTTPGVGI